MRLSAACALFVLGEVVAHGVKRSLEADVAQVVDALFHEVRAVLEVVDLRLGQSANFGEQAPATGGDVRIFEHEIRVHPFEHALDLRSDGGFVGVVLFEDAAHVHESAAVVGAQDTLVGDAEVFDDVEHLVPAVEGNVGVVPVEVRRLLLGILSIAIVRLVEVDDASRAAKRFHEEGVVGPTCSGDGLEPNVELVEEALPVDSRPDGRVVVEQVDGVGDDERLLIDMHASLVAALELLLCGRVGVFDAPIRRLDDVDFLGETCRELQHVLEHAGFDPVVGLEDGDPLAVRFLQAAIARGSVTLVLLVDDDDALVVFGVALHDLQGVVGRAVVQADDLEVVVRLAFEAVERLVEVGARIVDRDDHRDERMWVVYALLCGIVRVILVVIARWHGVSFFVDVGIGWKLYRKGGRVRFVGASRASIRL